MDHLSGYLEMLDTEEGGLEIGSFILPDMPPGDDNYERLLQMADHRGIKVMKIKAGDSFSVGNLGFSCLNPPEGAVFTDVNEYSVCLSITLKGSSFAALYTGDAQGEGEAEMMRSIPSRTESYTLLKCAHHGSRNSTPEAFLDMVSPVYTFISAGVDNSYGHPHEELMNRLDDAGTKTYVTKDKGAVRMDTDGKKARITFYIK